jgi:PAS domain S-box-containing protein
MDPGMDNDLALQAENIRRHLRKVLKHLMAASKCAAPNHADLSDCLSSVDDTGLQRSDPVASWRLIDPKYPEILEALPVAIYATDAEGRITFYNEAAAALWGRRPVLGEERWCGSWRIYLPDGTPLPHDRCPMAVALRENRKVRNVQAIAERPDGTRVHFMPYPTPLRDASDALIGAVNILIDIGSLREHLPAYAAPRGT